MAYNVPSKPIALGKLTPVPNTPLRITTNLDAGPPADGRKANGNTSRFDDLFGNKVFIQNIGPSGNIYIGFSTMVVGTLVGVLAKLPVGSSWSLEDKMQIAPFHAGDYFVDSDDAAAYCIGSVDV